MLQVNQCTFKRVPYNLPRNLTGSTQRSALHSLNVKGKQQRTIFNSVGICCGEMRKQSKSLTHNHLTPRGLTELMMLDIFCCLSHSISPISATSPCDSETRPDKRKDAFREETIYTWGHKQQLSNDCLHTSPGEARNLSSRERNFKKPFFQRVCKIHCKQKEKNNSRKIPSNTSFLSCP